MYNFSELLKNQRLVILPKDLIVYLFEGSEKSDFFRVLGIGWRGRRVKGMRKLLWIP
jgi:hypothetical protein